MKKILFSIVSLIGTTQSIWANVFPNTLFSNNMVLQSEVTVPVWGRADASEEVTVELCGQKVTTIAKEGKWMMQLKPLKSGGPFVMTIKGKNTITLSNVMVGQVWVCSGQSNMERIVGDAINKPLIDNYREELNDATNYPQIRLYRMQNIASDTFVTEINSKWLVCDTNSIKRFSSVAYFFARALTKEIKEPIGLILSAVGGTPAENWTSRAALENNPELNVFVKRYEMSIESYPATLSKFLIQKDSLFAKWRLDSAFAAKNKKIIPIQPRQPISPQKSGRCGGLFNGMIYPMIPFAIKGVIWYQGEANRGEPKQYQTLFPTLINDWRTRWKMGDFPFLFVQLAPFVGCPPEIRESQLLTLNRVRNTGMAVTVDCGDSADIHPTHKRPVGERLALAARAIAYHQNIAYSGPIYKSMRVIGNKIEVTFDHIHSGLSINGDALNDFVIAGVDKKFVPAIAILKGDKVIVTSPEIEYPVAVRMGWRTVPHSNLYNKDGLPASPFRTDVE